jgi:hypothetical protein
MRTYSRSTRCHTRYYMRLLCSDFATMDYWTLIMALCALLAVLFVSVLFPTAVSAADNIADPGDQPGLRNLFAGLAPGAHIRAGLGLPDSCGVTDVQIGAGGYFNRSANGPYAIGDHVRLVVITCTAPLDGIALHGDQDPKDSEQPTRWYLDGVEWTPPTGANVWQSLAFTGVREFRIVGGGDSFFMTIFAAEATTALETTQEPEAIVNRLWLPTVATGSK